MRSHGPTYVVVLSEKRESHKLLIININPDSQCALYSRDFISFLESPLPSVFLEQTWHALTLGLLHMVMPRSCQYQGKHLSAISVLSTSFSDLCSCISSPHLQEFQLLPSFIPTGIYSLLLFHQLLIFLTLHVSTSVFI